jgi:predicted MFS family arabinose efflux permease
MKALRNRAVLALLLFNLLAGILFVGGALLVSFMRSFGTTPDQLAWLLFPFSPSLPSTYLFYALYCLGNSMGFYASVFVMDVAPETLKGRAVGLFNAAMYLGSALGDSMGGAFWQRWGAHFSFALAAGAFLLGTLLLFWGRRTEGRTYETGKNR